jgi:hypothetical protein
LVAALPWMVATPLAYAMYYLLYLLFECSDAAFHVIVEGARASVTCPFLPVCEVSAVGVRCRCPACASRRERRGSARFVYVPASGQLCIWFSKKL